MNDLDFTTTELHGISPEMTLMEAIRSMKALDVNLLPVSEDDEIIASITESDIVMRAADRDCDLRVVRVREVMSREIICCFEDQDTKEAAEIMRKKRVRRLPVLNQNKRLLGHVTLGDLAIHCNIGKKVGGILMHHCAPA
jgi:CBS domain-containing protein